MQLGDTSLDFMDIGEDVREPGGAKDLKPQHYAFLVSELEFDESVARIRERNLHVLGGYRPPRPAW